jgi:hypothetical protein
MIRLFRIMYRADNQIRWNALSERVSIVFGEADPPQKFTPAD